MAVTIEKKPPAKKRGNRLAAKNREAVCERIFRLIVKGSTLIQACASDVAYPSPSTVYAWMNQYPELRQQYELALEISQDELADQITRIPGTVAIGDVSYTTSDGKRIEERTADRLTRAGMEAKLKQWRVGRRESRLSKPEAELGGGMGFVGQSNVYVVVGGLPDIPLGEFPTDEERLAEIERARLPHERRSGMLLEEAEAHDVRGSGEYEKEQS
jgi:hypothetical protein